MKKFISYLIVFAICIFSGMFTGIVMGILTPDIDPFFQAVIIYISLFVSYPLTIIIHECGHLVTGLMTGYKFSSFRIGKKMLVKENNKFKIKKFSILGTGGQCLLVPPEYDENFPWFFYNLGGCLFNFLITILCIVFTIIFSNNYILVAILTSFIYMNLASCLINIIPLQLGMPNDGYNILMIFKEKESRWCIYSQLMIGDLQIKGIKYQDMDPGLFQIPEHANLNNPLYQPILLTQINILHEQFKFIEAKELIEKINQKCKLFPILKNECDCEYLFYLLMENPNNSEIKILYKKISKYLNKTSKIMAGRQRILYAYELLVNKDQTKADKHLASFNKLIQSHPFQAEIECEKEIIKLIEKEACK